MKINMEYLTQVTELKNFKIEIDRLQYEIYNNDSLSVKEFRLYVQRLLLLKKLYLVKVRILVDFILEKI